MTTDQPNRGVRAVKFEDGWRTDPIYAIDVEPCPKRVRVEFGGETVADSLGVLTLREQGHLPVYYFPKADVRMDLMTPTNHHTHCPHKGDARYWTLAVDGHTAEDAVWAYDDPFEQMTVLKDHVAFYWSKMDRWLEEDETVLVHPRDPRKRIDIVASTRPVRVVLGGETVAESSDALFLFETDLPTRYYLPAGDVRTDRLTATDTRTRCPYKGEAVYWSAAVGGETFEDVVWSYPDPVAEAGRIKDRLCFYDENVDAVFVDGVEQPKPQTRWSKR
jgi:uncharacterized protein (DUF427 family)